MFEWLFGGKGDDVLKFNEEREQVIKTLSHIETQAIRQREQLIEIQRREEKPRVHS